VIGAAQQQQLLVLARSALEARVRGGGEAVSVEDDEHVPAGAFVSIHRHGALRGCLGRLDCEWSLNRVVAYLATALADSDPRFEPVSPDELPELEIEISILTPERPIAGIEEIEVGRHGVIVEQGRSRGLLLPQVAAEHGWGVTQFVAHTCLKAGLPPDAWRSGARVYVFEALVFAEQPS
jgi:AmmeMemoRadiSam system protein A